MEDRAKEGKLPLFCLLALLHLATPTSGFLTLPADLSVALGAAAVFRCGVPEASRSVTFNFSGNIGNYSLKCPSGDVKDLPHALSGSCERTTGEFLAVWTLKGTSLPDNGTRVRCQQPDNPKVAAAVLFVYESGSNKLVLIGCTIGGFFGMMLVLGFVFVMMRRSETLQKCYRGEDPEDDMNTMVTKE